MHSAPTDDGSPDPEPGLSLRVHRRVSEAVRADAGTVSGLHRDLLDAGLDDAVDDALRSLPGSTVAEFRAFLEAVGVDALDGLVARSAANAAAELRNSESAGSAHERFHHLLRGLGRGSVDGHPTSTSDVFEATAVLLAATFPPTRTVEIVLDDAWADRRREQRERVLEFVFDLAVSSRVELAVSRRAADVIHERHRDDPWVPPSVTKRCKAGGMCGRAGASESGDVAATVREARAELDADGRCTAALRALSSAESDSLPYRTLRTAIGLGDASESYVRVIAKRVADLGLARRDTRPDGRTYLELSTAGKAYLDAVLGEEGVQSVFPDSVSVTPPKSLPICRVTRAGTDPPAHAGESGRPADEGDAAAEPETDTDRRGGLAGVEWLRRDRQEATLATAERGSVTLSDAVVPRSDDPRTPRIGLDEDRDTLLVSADARNPMQYMATIARALTSPLLREWIADRLGAEFAGLSESSLNILRDARCVGWLREDDADGAAWIDRLESAHDTLCELTRRHHSGQYEDRNEFRGEITRFAHGLVGSVVSMLELAGVDVIREVRTPEFSRHFSRSQPKQRQFLAEMIGTMASVQSRYGHFSTYRSLFETRPDKQRSAMSPDVDAADPVGSLLGSIVLVGDGVSTFADELRAHLSSPMELRDDAPEFQVRIPVVKEHSPAATRQVVESMLDARNIRATDDAVGVMHGFARSPYAAAEALAALGSETTRRPVRADELRYALSQIDEKQLFQRETTPTQRTGLATLLDADEPISQAELTRRSDFSAQSWRNNRDALVTAGLVEHVDDGWRLSLPFRGEDEFDAETDLPWPVAEAGTRPGLLQREKRRPVDVLAEALLDVVDDGSRLGDPGDPVGRVAGASDEPPPMSDVETVIDEFELGVVWRFAVAGCGLNEGYDPPSPPAAMGPPLEQSALSSDAGP